MRERRIENYISRMPSLSNTVTKVIEICNNPQASANDLNRVISFDPVLTARVLRLVNSAYYALLNRVNSLTRAIIMLGVNTVKNLVLSTAVLERLDGQDHFQSLSTDGFWTHSLCVGVSAKLIAAGMGVPVTEREEYFVAGLLHDLGKIPLHNSFPEDYAGAVLLAKERQMPLWQAERIVFGFDHGHVGEMIADRWQLRGAFQSALAAHHHEAPAPDEHRRLMTVVTAANTFANVFTIGTAGDFFPENVWLDDVLAEIGIDWSYLFGLCRDVWAEIEKARIFLHVSRKSG